MKSSAVEIDNTNLCRKSDDPSSALQQTTHNHPSGCDEGLHYVAIRGAFIRDKMKSQLYYYRLIINEKALEFLWEMNLAAVYPLDRQAVIAVHRNTLPPSSPLVPEPS